MATLSTLRTDTYDILNDLQTSNVYGSSFVDQVINEQTVEVCAKQKWQFLRSKKLFLGASDTTLTNAVATTDTSIDVGVVTNFEQPGAIWVNHDVISYETISSTTLETVTNIDIAHNAGDKALPLYLIPTDYERMPVLKQQPQGSDRFYAVTYVDEMTWDNAEVSNDIIRNKFTVINSEDDSNLYLRVNKVGQGDNFVFYYIKKPLELTDDADVSTIPDPYARKIIPKLAAYKLMILRNDNMEGLGTIIKEEAMQELLAMEKLYGQREEGWSRLIQPTYKSQVRENSNFKYVRI